MGQLLQLTKARLGNEDVGNPNCQGALQTMSHLAGCSYLMFAHVYYHEFKST
jgi:hypothetical protein